MCARARAPYAFLNNKFWRLKRDEVVVLSSLVVVRYNISVVAITPLFPAVCKRPVAVLYTFVTSVSVPVGVARPSCFPSTTVRHRFCRARRTEHHHATRYHGGVVVSEQCGKPTAVYGVHRGQRGQRQDHVPGTFRQLPKRVPGQGTGTYLAERPRSQLFSEFPTHPPSPHLHHLVIGIYS